MNPEVERMWRTVIIDSLMMLQLGTPLWQVNGKLEAGLREGTRRQISEELTMDSLNALYPGNSDLDLQGLQLIYLRDLSRHLGMAPTGVAADGTMYSWTLDELGDRIARWSVGRRCQPCFDMGDEEQAVCLNAGVPYCFWHVLCIVSGLIGRPLFLVESSVF